MASLNVILSQLKTDLSTKIDPANDYHTKPVIKHGIYSRTQLDGKFPAVCFEIIKEEIAAAMAGNRVQMHYFITIYGYAKSEGIKNTDAIRSLAHDVLYFIFSDDWTYTTDTWIVSEITYSISTETDNVSMFDFTIKIKDTIDVSTIKEN